MSGINILPKAQQNELKKCNSKCSYSFNYKTSSCTIKNKGDFLLLGYDDNNGSKVNYNGRPYKIKEIRLYSPSINTYNSEKADVELAVVHQNNYGDMLVVYVPFIKSSVSTSASNLFDQIIPAAPSKNSLETTVANTNDYSLNHLIPKNKFFTYNDNLPWESGTKDVNFIVFDVSPSSATISPSAYNILIRKLSKVHTYKTSKKKVFVNVNGSTNIGGSKDQEIFISCNPAGQSDKFKDVIEDVGTGRSGNVGAGVSSFQEFLNDYLVPIIIFTSVTIIAGIFRAFGPWIKSTFSRIQKSTKNAISERKNRKSGEKTIEFRTRRKAESASTKIPPSRPSSIPSSS